MITKSEAKQLSELLGLPETQVEDMAFIEGFGLIIGDSLHAAGSRVSPLRTIELACASKPLV